MSAKYLLGGQSTSDAAALVVDFAAPGPTAVVSGTQGERCYFTRPSAAMFCLDGSEVTAAIDEARVTDDGILIEPGTTNWVTDPLDLNSGNWYDAGDSSASIATTGHSAPDGSLTAWRYLTQAANQGQGLYQWDFVGHPGNQVFSIWAKPVGNIRYLRICSNPLTETAIFDLLTQRCTAITGANTRGEIEQDANGWSRCSVFLPSGIPAAWGQVVFAVSVDGINWTFAGGAGGIDFWRPQCEAQQYATTWTVATRAAESLLVPLPPLGLLWSVELVVRPAGAQNWARSNTSDMLVSLGHVGGGESCTVYGIGGYLEIDTIDTGAQHKLANQAASYGPICWHGQRRVLISSSTDILGDHPHISVDGIDSTAGAGVGSGVIRPGGPQSLTLFVGCDSLGNAGGFIVRQIIVRRQPSSPIPLYGVMMYSWGMYRGHVQRSHCVAWLGDSNTQGVADPTNPAYPEIACRSLGYQAHNYGIAGSGVHDCYLRWTYDLPLYRYACVCVMIGTNDIGADVQSAEIVRLLAKMLAEATARNIFLIVGTIMPCGQNPGTNRDAQLKAVNAWIRANVQHYVETYLPLDDPAHPGYLLAAYQMGDDLHLNAAGATLVAAAFEALVP